MIEFIIFIAKVIGNFAAVVLIMASPWIIINTYTNKHARKIITKYCMDNGYDLIKFTPHKNHFGADIMHKNKKYYVKFNYDKNNNVVWKGKTPEFLQNA